MMAFSCPFSFCCTTIIFACFIYATASEKLVEIHDHDVTCDALGPYDGYTIQYPPSQRTSISVEGLGDLSLHDIDDYAVQGGFSSTFLVHAVIVKGEDRAQVIRYDPAVTEDPSPLKAPESETARVAGQISSICICYSLQVLLCDVAAGSYEKIVSWQIIKTAQQEQFILPSGQYELSTYHYKEVATVLGQNYVLDGSVIVRNPSVLNSVTLNLHAQLGYDTLATGLTLNCAPMTAPIVTLPPAGSVTCQYHQVLSSAPSILAPVWVFADVVSGVDVHSATSVTIPIWTPHWIDRCLDATEFAHGENIDISTTLPRFCVTCDDTLVEGDLSITVGSDECGRYDVTDQIVGITSDQQLTVTSDEVTVYVEIPCPLLFDANSAGSNDEHFDWTLLKSGNTDPVFLDEGEEHTFSYGYLATQTMTEDNWSISGGLTVCNPNTLYTVPIAQIFVAFGSIVLGNPPSCTLSSCSSPTPSSSVSIPTNLDPGTMLTCTFASSLPFDQPDGTTTNINVDVAPAALVLGVTFSEAPSWSIGQTFDECITLYDTPSNQVIEQNLCATTQGTFVETWTWYLCGAYNLIDQLLGVGDTSQFTSSELEIPVEVPCDLILSDNVYGNNDLLYLWNVEKSTENPTLVSPPSTSLSIAYQYALTPVALERLNWVLSGQVSVCNPNQLYTVQQSLTVTFGALDITPSLTCWTTTCADPLTILAFALPTDAILAGNALQCQFTETLTSEPSNATALTVFADVDQTISPLVSDSSDSSATPDWILNEVLDECVTLTDDRFTIDGEVMTIVGTVCDYVDPWTNSFTYQFIEDQCGSYELLDTIIATGLDTGTSVTSTEVSVNVEVPCALGVTLVPSGSYDLQYYWTILKSAQDAILQLDVNEEYIETYYYTLTPTTDNVNWEVSGDVTVSNPNSVQDASFEATVSFGPQSVTATCPTNHLNGGDSTTCQFTISFASQPDPTWYGSVVVTAVPSYMSAGATAGATTFSLDEVIDECVAITDYVDNVPRHNLGLHCANAQLDPITESFPDSIVKCECGNFYVSDYLKLVGEDSLTVVLSNTVTIAANVLCNLGCVHSQGYWKNHLTDPTWSDYIDVYFYSSGVKFPAVYSQQASNKYWKVAGQFVATLLNLKAGAVIDESATQTAIAEAEYFFSHYGPNNWPQSEDIMTELNDPLAAFNEGQAGTPQCAGEL